MSISMILGIRQSPTWGKEVIPSGDRKGSGHFSDLHHNEIYPSQGGGYERSLGKSREKIVAK
jgi:hypothetical protein